MAAVELTRRQWLLATGALAAGSCRGSQTGPRWAGEFLGPDPKWGHLVRDPPVDHHPDRDERADVVILGGGVSGLSAAWALARAGVHDFAVLEMDDQPGGTARGGSGPVSQFPLGAHYLPVPSSVDGARSLGVLLQELGVLTGFDAAGRAICGEEHLCRAPQERIYHKGRWYEGLYLRAGASAEDLRQLQRFHEEIGTWVRRRDAKGRRTFSVPGTRGRWRAAGAAELDGLSMADYLDRRGFTSPRLRWQIDYGCRDDFGVTLAHASAYAGVHYYAARLLHPDDAPPQVLTWPEGNARLVAGLLTRVGAERVRTRCLVTDVRPLPNEEGVEVFYRAPIRGGAGTVRGRLTARAAIFALPSYLRRHLIAPLRAAPPPWLQRYTYAPWLVANLTLRRAPPPPIAPAPGEKSGFPLCWDNVLYESPSLGYVVATHQREPPPSPDGIPRTVWTYYLPLCGTEPQRERARLLGASHTELSTSILADLRRAEPELPDQVERIDLVRWGHGMIRPVPGLFTSGALEQAAMPLGPIHFAHTDLGGMALFEEAHHSGVIAAEAVMARLGHRFESLLPPAAP